MMRMLHEMRENRSDSKNITQQYLSAVIDRTLYTDENLLASHLMCAMIGIPANLFVMGLIIGSKRLRNPRTFVWLGVGFANILMICYSIGEFIVVCWPSPETIEIVDWVVGLPQLNLLVSNLIPIIERYVCLKYPHWHRENVTNKKIIIVQVGSLIIICLVVKSCQLYDDELNFSLTLSSFVPLLNSVLIAYVLCLAIQLVFKAKFSRTYLPARGLRHPPTSLMSNSPFVHIEDEQVSRLNLEAAYAAILSGRVLLAFCTPGVTLAVFDLNSCLSSTGLTGCIERFRLFAYLVELVTIYCSVVSPVLFIFTSRDILSVLRDRLLDDDDFE